MPVTTTTTTADATLIPIVRDWLRDAADRIIASRERLTDLDARIGDGDHGINLARGMTRVRAALEDGASGEDAAGDAGAILVAAGRRLISSVGGASGPLYGTLLLEAGAALAVAEGSFAARLGSALEAGVAGVGRRGRSTAGQKTMLDTLVPASTALTDAAAGEATAAEAMAATLAAARTGCEATREMIGQRGRASYLGERSIGHLDPGAVSSLLLIEALAAATGVTDGRPAVGQPAVAGATSR